MLKKYIQLGNTNPFLFTSINSFTISLLGEYMIQTFELKVMGRTYDKNVTKNIIDDKNEKNTDQIKQNNENISNKLQSYTDYDIDRFKKMTMYRVFVGNPLTYTWYTKAIPYIFPVNSGSKITTKKVLWKVSFDQTIFAPWCIVVFNYFMMTMDGNKHEQSMKRIQRDFYSIMLIDWFLWPALSFVNFKYVPINYQPSVVYCGSMVWTAIMSWFYNREVSE